MEDAEVPAQKEKHTSREAKVYELSSNHYMQKILSSSIEKYDLTIDWEFFYSFISAVFLGSSCSSKRKMLGSRVIVIKNRTQNQ